MINKLLEAKPFEINILMVVEELNELSQAILKYERYRKLGKISKLVELRKQVLEEYNDVNIGQQLVEKMFDFSYDEINNEYNEKMKRNIERI